MLRCGEAIYSLLGAGFHVRRGFSPIVAHKLWRTYAIASSLYGLELMITTKKDLDTIEFAHRKIPRQIQGLPNIATYTLIGAEPADKSFDLFMNVGKKLRVNGISNFRETNRFRRCLLQYIC